MKHVWAHMKAGAHETRVRTSQCRRYDSAGSLMSLIAATNTLCLSGLAASSSTLLVDVAASCAQLAALKSGANVAKDPSLAPAACRSLGAQSEQPDANTSQLHQIKPLQVSLCCSLQQCLQQYHEH